MKTKPTDYSWVTTELFDSKLQELINGLGLPYILSIPGVEALVREDLNNDVLAALVEELALAEDGSEWDDLEPGAL